MRLKSYFAGSVETALQQARRELGEDAMLVSSRRAAPEAARLGEYEVVFAVPKHDASATGRTAPSGPAPADIPEGEAGTANNSPPLWEMFRRELAALRGQVQRVSRSIERQYANEQAPALSSALDSVEETLAQSGIHRDLAHRVLEALQGKLLEGAEGEDWPDPEKAAYAVAEQVMQAMMPAPVNFQAAESEQKRAMFIGPPGAGKTTTLVKIAARYGLHGRRRTHIISLDNNRIAGADQLRCLSAILGLGFDALEAPHLLRQLLEEQRNRDMLLIDTPGYSARDRPAAEELAEALEGLPRIETHLVLTASMKPADLSRVVDRFRGFRPSSLVFTKVDETDRLGPVWQEAVKLGIPVSFLCAGQRIPEDLEEADVGRILRTILNPHAAVKEYEVRLPHGRLGWDGVDVRRAMVAA
jgi:flagellar biosynthesis protein FlhF